MEGPLPPGLFLQPNGLKGYLDSLLWPVRLGGPQTREINHQKEAGSSRRHCCFSLKSPGRDTTASLFACQHGEALAPAGTLALCLSPAKNTEWENHST